MVFHIVTIGLAALPTFSRRATYGGPAGLLPVDGGNGEDQAAAVVHLLADDAGMTVYVGCPDLLGGEDGGTVLADFYHEVLGW